MIVFDQHGMYCPQANVYIDPWRPVDKAIVTHAHSDHARWGMRHYLAHHHSVPIMQLRLGKDISVEGLEYGDPIYLNGVKISLHPAGHIPGSAQVRLEYKGEVWVISGDYKTSPDLLTTPFEPVPCHTFVTESTFGLPVYQWENEEKIFERINAWWKHNQSIGKTSVILAYALGKSQRVLMGLDTSIGSIFTHGAVESTNEVLRNLGYPLPDTVQVQAHHQAQDFAGAMVIAPPSVQDSSWLRRMEPCAVAMASGWMALRGTRRRRNLEMGFTLSDHADWQGLNEAVQATGAQRVYVTHGYSEIFARWLREEKGLDANVVKTNFVGEHFEETEESPSEK